VNKPKLSEDIETIRSILERQNLSLDALAALFKEKGVTVPVSVFKTRAGPLGVLCMFLKDHGGMRFVDIAKLIKRDQKTIWASYTKTKKKVSKLDTSSKLLVPVEIFANRNNSIMENLSLYLVRVQRMRLIEIAHQINRSNKTVWCFYHRAKNE